MRGLNLRVIITPRLRVLGCRLVMIPDYNNMLGEVEIEMARPILAKIICTFGAASPIIDIMMINISNHNTLIDIVRDLQQRAAEFIQDRKSDDPDEVLLIDFLREASIELDLISSHLQEVVFRAEWPFVFDTMKSGSFATEFEPIPGGHVFLKDGIYYVVGSIAGMEAWLDEHCGQEGWTRGPHFLYGIKDKNAAFHFRCRWM